MDEALPTTIEHLRESVAIRVHATSLRAVARQVGMSPSGLEKFLAGGMPYTNTRRKLVEWWYREGAESPVDLSADGVAVALGSLVRDLPPDRRERTLRELVGTLRELYASHGAPCPSWLHEIPG